ncbi:MAG: hypothetical protein ACJ71S_10390, partial [Acidobacteriaceae bacterium]
KQLHNTNIYISNAYAQVLRQRYPGRTECPDTHLRLTARHQDGSPAAGLRPQDLYLWLSLGTADIRSMESESAESEKPEKPSYTSAPATPNTNVLIVIRPQLPVDAGMADAVLRNLQAAPNRQWKIAVLAPDGSVSPFLARADQAALRKALTHVASTPAAPGIADWATAERNAFRQLQSRAGRHVVVELTPLATTGHDAFAEDRTLDLLARDDMAQIYRLVHGGKDQVEATGGRSAPTVDALFRDIVADAPGSYDLVLHPMFSCEPGTSYSLRITSFRPEVQLFYPTTIRMAAAGSH